MEAEFHKHVFLRAISAERIRKSLPHVCQAPHPAEVCVRTVAVKPNRIFQFAGLGSWQVNAGHTFGILLSLENCRDAGGVWVAVSSPFLFFLSFQMIP